MNLYLVSQDINQEYDTYDSVVVAAPDEEAARCVFPFNQVAGKYGGDWVHETEKHHLEVTLIGYSVKGIDDVVLASFNAG